MDCSSNLVALLSSPNPQELQSELEAVRGKGSVDCSVLRGELCVKVWNDTMCYTADDDYDDDYTTDTINICGGIDLTTAQALSGNYSNNTCFTGCGRLRTVCSSDTLLDDVCPERCVACWEGWRPPHHIPLSLTVSLLPPPIARMSYTGTTTTLRRARCPLLFHLRSR